MVSMEKVTVDKAYFDALLRRADCHSSEPLSDVPDPVNITISRIEYHSLLRAVREYEILKNALFQGGVTAETLDLLISGPQNTEQITDSLVEPSEQWTENFSRTPTSGLLYFTPYNHQLPRLRPGRSYAAARSGEHASFNSGHLQQPPPHRRMPSYQRQTSFGMMSLLEDVGFGDEQDSNGDGSPAGNSGLSQPPEKRTLFFSGLSERTTYLDLVSNIHGGKLLSIGLRPTERNALVTFVDGAADFLAWTKRNDLYVHTKRIEVKWADNQFRMNEHTAQRIANGASRNIVIKSAMEKGLTEQQIREDMEHIHNLVIIDVTFRDGDAYVSTNSVSNALFARTCMMSRTSYKGCKVEFYRDECDIPAPPRSTMPKVQSTVPAKKKQRPITNRFDLLNLDGMDDDSDEENRSPSDSNDADEETVDEKTGVGVSLTFLDAESVI